MRCRSTLFLRRHDAMFRQKRDVDGRVVRPHVLIWECRRCGCDVGQTKLSTRFDLLADLRRQAVALRKEIA